MTGDLQKELSSDVTDLVKKLGSSKGKELFSSSKSKRVKSIRSTKNKSKKQWKEKDDYRLFRAVKKFGPLWDKVATKFDNKTAEDCRNRWSHFITTIPVTTENTESRVIDSSKLPDNPDSLVIPSTILDPVSTEIPSQSFISFNNENQFNPTPLKDQDLFTSYPHLSSMDLGYIASYMTQTNHAYPDISSKEYQNTTQGVDLPHNIEFTQSKERDFEKLIDDCFAKNIGNVANQFDFLSIPFENLTEEFNTESPVNFVTREHGTNPFISPHIPSDYSCLNQNGTGSDTPNNAFDFSPVRNSVDVRNSENVAPELDSLSLPLFFQPENGSKLKSEILQEDCPMPAFPESFGNDPANTNSFINAPSACNDSFNPQYLTFLQNELNSPFGTQNQSNQKEPLGSFVSQNPCQIQDSSLYISSKADATSHLIDFEALCNIMKANQEPPQENADIAGHSNQNDNNLNQSNYNFFTDDPKTLKNVNDLSSSEQINPVPFQPDASDINETELILLAAKIYGNPKLISCLVEITNIFSNDCRKKVFNDIDSKSLCSDLNRKRPLKALGHSFKRSCSQHNSPAITQSHSEFNESTLFSNQLVTPSTSNWSKRKYFIDSSSSFVPNSKGFVSADNHPCNPTDFFQTEISTAIASQEETLFSYDVLRKIREQQVQNQQLVIQAYSIETRFRGPESHWALYWKKQALNIKRNSIFGESYSTVSLDEPLYELDSIPTFLSFHVVPGARIIEHVLDMIADPPEYLVSYPTTCSPSPAVKKAKNKTPKAQNLAYYFPDNEFCIQGSPRTQVEKARGIHILCKKVFEPIFDSQLAPFFLFTKKRERPIFSSGEDELLRIGLEIYADDWSTIRSHFLPVRPSRQLENRFNNLKSGRQENNLIQKYYINATKPLSEEEEILLSKGIEVFGKNFRDITRYFLPTRPSFFLKRVKRDSQLRKKKAKSTANTEGV